MNADALLRRIRIGMTRAEVRGVLGEPDDVGATPRGRRVPAIYRYGRIELHFEPGREGGLVLVYTEDEGGEGRTLLK